ncbi:InlB B-repeat-containing protein [Neobacillus drentensis]|uniref:InlB B-repeat-containing protein n=1 Tax=Neobacillus drentensis TaxID=220684 RepID=UPI002FFF9179
MKRNKWRFSKTVTTAALALSMVTGNYSSLVVKAAPTVSTQAFNVKSISTTRNIYMNTTQITHAKPTGLDTSKPVKWTTSDPYVAYVDKVGNVKGDYSGKILGVTGGTAIITGTGVDFSGAAKTVTITVTVAETQDNTFLDKFVYYYAAGDASIPEELRNTQWQTTDIPAAPAGKTFPSKNYVGYVEGEDGVKWLVSKDTLMMSSGKVDLTSSAPMSVTSGIVSDAVTLYDPNLSSADQIQYLQGGRYIPQTGASQPGTNAVEVITNIMPDGDNGLWVLGSAGNATHIARKQVSLMSKALLQEEISRNFTDRYGFQSGNMSFTSQAEMKKALMTADTDAARGNYDTDNDGLWTTMYASGEIWRYNYMKKTFGDSDERTKDAKASAVRAVESIVTLGYISGMQLKVPSKNNVNDVVYVVNALGGNVKTVEQGKLWLKTNEAKPVFVDDNGKYTLTDTGKPASAGFFARTYKVDGSNNGATIAEAKSFDTAWLKKKAGTTTDITGKSVNYSVPGQFKNGQATNVKAYDTVAIPTRLTKIVNDQNPSLDEDTKDLDSDKVYYKATTSTDELVGHYFTLDLAYNAFKDSDPELAALIKNDLINHTNSVILNNYYQMSITGENALEPRYNGVAPGNGLNATSSPTRWGNMNPEFLDGVPSAWVDGDYEDGPLNATLALQMLVAARDMGNYTPAEKEALEAQGIHVIAPLDYANEYKVMTGQEVSATDTTHNDYEKRYPKSYNSTSLLDMSKQYVSRYFGISAHNGDDMGVSGVSYDSYMNYSDEEEAALSYYTLSHHAEKATAPGILYGMNQWWYNEKREKNPFMSEFYAASLGALKAKGFDIGDATVDRAGSEWGMKRIPNNYMNWDVLSANRNDVTHEAGDLMVDQLIPRDEVKMSKYNTNIFGTHERRTVDSGTSNTLESSTVISMPYWITQNPEDAENIADLGSKVTAPVNNGTESLTYPTNLAKLNPNAKYDADSHTFTIDVGDSVKLDAIAKGYIKNVSWLTDAWTQTGYVNGVPTKIIADSSKADVIDLRALANYKEVGNVDATGISVNGDHYGAYATGLKPGTVTVTGYVIDGFFRTPQKVTYTINVVDPKNSAELIAPTSVDTDTFAYPTWLKKAMASTGLNTDGNQHVEVTFESSSPSDVVVDSDSGAVNYITDQPATITATVTYSAVQIDDSPTFANDSHIMTFERTVSRDAVQTVTFDSKGGTTVDPVTASYKDPIVAPTAPSKTGYTFIGWFNDAVSTTVPANFGAGVTESVKLTAHWKINSYNVAFNSNGGSAVTTKKANYNTIIAKPANPTRKGFVFVGWYKDAAFKTAWNFTTDKVTANTTLYAKWMVASPTGLKAAKINSTSIKLTWTAVNGVSGYEIDRATAMNFTGKVTKTTAAGTFTATGLVKGKTYYFKARAYTVVGKIKVYSNYTTVVAFKL